MEARAKLFGHPIHQILIVFPLGLLATSFFFDLAWLAKGRAELAVVAHWMIFAGVGGGCARESRGGGGGAGTPLSPHRGPPARGGGRGAVPPPGRAWARARLHHVV